VDDFQFALRNDPKKLGRVQEMLEKEKGLKLARKAFDLPEGAPQKGIGEDGEVKTKGKRGRKKRASAEGVDDSPRKGGKKRRKSDGGSQLMNGGGIGEEDVDLDDEGDD
jgi:transcription initiation factor TFIID subunit 13